MRSFLILTLASVFVGCTGVESPGPSENAGRGGRITIGDFRGMNHEDASDLIDNLDLDVQIEEVPLAAASGDRTEPLVQGTVLRQDPEAGTKVDPGSTLTFFITRGRGASEGERPFKLLTHCGLSYPLDYDHRSWLPVDKALRRTINAPRGFHSDGYYDRGSIRRVDVDSLVYISSTGIHVEYEPSSRRGQGCE